MLPTQLPPDGRAHRVFLLRTHQNPLGSTVAAITRATLLLGKPLANGTKIKD
jgi:hypothetical protein